MWKVVGASIRGTSHVRDDKPCQDYIKYYHVSETCCIALSDGAGSYIYPEKGAQISCDAICQLIEKSFDEFYELQVDEIKRKLIHKIRTRIGIHAKNKNVSKDEFSATLLFVAIKSEKFLLGHIGDGVIGCLKDGKLIVLSNPENGEFANTTYFVTSKNYQKHLRLIKGINDGSEAFFLMSDGAAECLYSKKDNKFANALLTMSSWIHNNDESVVSEAIEENMSRLFPKHTQDDCSIIIMQKRHL